MSTRIPTTDKTMRKAPKQARSKATVRAIVEAGTHVLGQRGWGEFTTNEVADIAGVSIGSLYQYFPNKLSLVEAIRQQHFSDVLDVVKRTSESTSGLEESVDLLVQGMLAVHGSQPALHRALLEEVPRSEQTKVAHEEFERQYLDCYMALVFKYRKRRDAKRDRIAAQVLSAAVEGVVHYAALNGLLDSLALKQQLTMLICEYVHG